MPQAAASGGGLFRGGAERRRNELLVEERQKLVRESQERFRSRVLVKDDTYYRISDVSLAVRSRRRHPSSPLPFLSPLLCIVV